MSTRFLYFIGFSIIAALLMFSVYLQVYQGFNPCPLCTLQRLSFALTGVFFLIGAIFAGKKIIRILINLLALLSSSMGLFFATRQVWLQHFPPANSEECGVSLQYMMQVLPINEVFSKIIAGSAECTKVGWEFLSFNMAEWSVAWFLLLIGFILYLFKRECK